MPPQNWFCEASVICMTNGYAVVVVVGLNFNDEGERVFATVGGDRKSLVLPRDQDALVTAVAAGIVWLASKHTGWLRVVRNRLAALVAVVALALALIQSDAGFDTAPHAHATTQSVARRSKRLSSVCG